MTKHTLGSLAVVLALANLALAQTSEPAPVPEGAALPAAAPFAANWEPSGRMYSLYPAGQDWVSARTSYFWFRTEGLLWWVKPGPLPAPLLSTAPADAQNPGSLADPQTTVLLGSSNLRYGGFGGGRLTTGYWLDTDQTIGIEASGLLLQTQVVRFSVDANANGAPPLAVPVNSAVSGSEEASAIASPGAFTGSAAFHSISRFWSAELNAVGTSFRAAGLRAGWTAGFRYLGLQESLALVQNSTPLDGNALSFNGMDVLPPSRVTLYDQFDAYNQFFGGQIGGQLEFCRDRLFVSLAGKLAVGGSHQVVHVNGNSTLTTPGQAATVLPGGLFAVSSNIGPASRDSWAVVPEAGIRVGYQLSSRLSLSLAYNFLYWSSVARPGMQIDRTIDPTLVPTAAVFGQSSGIAERPVLNLQRTDFWAHGILLGLEWHF